MSAKLPPGPKGHLLSGHLAELKDNPLDSMTRWAREYGDVVAFRLGPKRALLFSHPDAIEYILVTGNRNFKKDFTLGLYRPILGNGLLTSEGDFWLRQRRLAQPAFQRQRIATYSETMVAFTQRMLTGWQDGAVVDVHAEMMRLTLEIAAKTLLNADATNEAREVGLALEEALSCIEARFGFLYWLPDWVPTRTNRRLRAAVRRLDAMLYRLIAQCRASGEGRGDLLSLLLHARDENDGGHMTDRQLRDEAMTLFLAGHETTALALTWTWYLLAQHPEVLAELQAELHTVLGDGPPSVADLPRLVYLERVLLEAMRLYPPAYGMGREAVRDCEISGYRVPAGMTIFMYPVGRPP
jgi:cytochrome P450